MTSLLGIDPKRIGNLPDALFTHLLNALLRAEASRYAVPQSYIDTTVKEKSPDGGVDAALAAHPALRGDWLPEGSSAWQYKAGQCPPVRTLAAKEFTKPGVVEAVERGDPYVFCTGDTITAKKKREIEAAIAKLYTARGKQPNGRVYTADHIGQWTEQHLGIAAEHFNVAIEGWQSFAQWATSSRLTNPFIHDQSRDDLIGELRGRIAAGEPFIRVVGDEGVGKTRTVLEALREPGLSERVLYLDDGATLDPRTFWHFRQSGPRSGILVIDECASETYARLENLVGSLPAGFMVVAVGPRPPVRRPSLHAATAGGALDLGPLSADAMAEIVGFFAPALSIPERQAIAARTAGSPKLLVVMANEIARSREPLRQWEGVERSARVEEFIVTELFGFPSTAPETRVMRSISLFTRLGWDGDLASEGRLVTEFFGLEWQEARLAAEELLKRGVVARRGRYLYATPDVLANHIVRAALDAEGRDTFVAFVTKLTPALRHALAERLRRLGGDAATILRDALELRSLEDLSRPGTAELIRLLAPALPDFVLDGLAALFNAASRDELKSFRRREIVWALEELAWWEDTFAPAARLLRRLAWAENERYANNATGVWVKLFQVMFGGTEVPFEERRELLAEALADPDPEVRRLGVLGVGASIKLERISRIGGPPTDTGRRPPGEWRPATYGEWWEIVRRSLRQLSYLLEDPDGRVREAVLTALATGGDLMNDRFMGEWCDVVGRLRDRTFEDRKRLLDLVTWRLRHPEGLSREALERLRTLEQLLAGASFSDRLRRVVGTWDLQRALPESKKGDDVMIELAREALATPAVLEAELPWLLSGKAAVSYRFGLILANEDGDETWRDRLIAAWNEHVADDRFITGYLAGVAERRGLDWLESLLDRWATDRDKALLVAHVTWRAVPGERAALRLAGLLRAGDVPAAFLGNLTYGFWARDLPPSAVRAMVEATSGDTSPAAAHARIDFLAQYLSNPDRLPELRDLVLRSIEEVLAADPLSPDVLHNWGELSEMVLDTMPLAVARAAVALASRSDFRAYEGPVLKMLKGAVDRQAHTVWTEVVAPAINEHPELLWTLDTPFGGRQLLAWFDPEDVLAWAEAAVATEERGKRLRLIASAVPVDRDILSPLARALIIRHGTVRGVLDTLSANFSSGAWSGRKSVYLKKKQASAKGWARDEHRAVRAWAETIARDLERQIDRARLEEQESGVDEPEPEEKD